jgi:hypothetical protein
MVVWKPIVNFQMVKNTGGRQNSSKVLSRLSGLKSLNQLRKRYETHPELVRYYICVPLDRPNARIKGQKSLMERWDDKVVEWETKARKSGREIEFIYWGSSELFSRLSRPEHIGRRSFWFNEIELDEDWFTQRLAEATNNLNKRYSPEVNFELPIATVFHGLGRDKTFTERWRSQFDELKVIANTAIRELNDQRISDESRKVSDVLQNLYHLANKNTPFRILIIDQYQISCTIKKAHETIDCLLDKLDELKRQDKQASTSSVSDQHIKDYSWDIRNFRNIKISLYDCENYVNSVEVQVANTPALALTGKAGMGKSHLLAAVSNARRERGLLSILILGQHLTTLEDPWTQILRELHIDCDRDTFLGVINTLGETRGSRVLMCVDALNEGQGRHIWEDHIGGFFEVLSHYPWIGLVISVRSSYQELLLPENVQKRHHISVVDHHGFELFEYEATKRFFSYYQIQLPSIPLLHPEFSNPLFLRLFCEGLYKKGLSQIPPGYEGISAILDFFLDAVDASLSKKYNFNKSHRLTRYTVDSLAAELLNIGSTSLPFDDAYFWILDLPKLRSLAEPDRIRFFEDLIVEGVLNKDLDYQWQEDKGEVSQREVIYFTYERFGDHLIAAHLIDQYVDKKNPENSFAYNPKLVKLFDNQRGLQPNQGLIEALSIQLPEQTRVELHQALPVLSLEESLVSGFIESILWRKHDSYSNTAFEYINRIILDKYWKEAFLDTIVSVSASVGHPLNSDFLHRELSSRSMADRDACWTGYLHFKYSRNFEEGASSVQRIIDWAWSYADKAPLNAESAFLLAQAITWFFTSTNRPLRDSATKALIALLENRIDTLLRLLQAFEKVNDPYIYERLWTAAYGCTMRTQDLESLNALANYTYETIFDKEEVYTHILLRDSARGVIERAACLGKIDTIDLAKVRPPYKSTFPTEYLTNEEIDERYEVELKTADFKPYHRLQNWILHSMTTEYGRGTGGYGDFGRYTFQSALRNWRDADLIGLSNLAVQWIFERYGWNVEKHGPIDWIIDKSRDRADRHSIMSERIGKKYQWLAMHEILALVADNVNFQERWSNNDTAKVYDGTWDPYIRDIDPSTLIKSTNRRKQVVQWWNPEQDMNWRTPHEEWLMVESDLPSPIDYIEVIDPQTKVEWLVLETYPSWKEPKHINEEQEDIPYKELWYQIRAYLVKSSEYKKFIEWGKLQNFTGRWMPEAIDRYELYSREYYWSPGWQSIKSRWQSDEESRLPWQDIEGRKRYRGTTEEFSGQVIVPTLRFSNEKSNDGSIEESIGYLKPSEFIFDAMKLNYGPQEGSLFNGKGEVVCIDPSVENASNSCLMVRKIDFINMLKENDLSVFWTVLGEKQIHEGMVNTRLYGRLDISGVVYFENDNLIHHQSIHEDKYEAHENDEEGLEDWFSIFSLRNSDLQIGEEE